MSGGREKEYFFFTVWPRESGQQGAPEAFDPKRGAVLWVKESVQRWNGRREPQLLIRIEETRADVFLQGPLRFGAELLWI